jgi:2-haloacid dehalogenase
MVSETKPRVLVFDAYGTLFDVASVQAACEAKFPGKGAALTQLWRQKQLEYTWLTSLMGSYRDFWELTRAGLTHAAGMLKLELSAQQAQTLLEQYWQLQTFPEAKEALTKLHGRLPLAILSNGTPDMLKRAALYSGIDTLLTDILSVDSVRIYKPSKQVYQLVCDRFEVSAREVAFVSGNSWDAHGAKEFGFRVFWLNRAGVPDDPLEPHPDKTLGSLADLEALV